LFLEGLREGRDSERVADALFFSLLSPSSPSLMREKGKGKESGERKRVSKGRKN